RCPPPELLPRVVVVFSVLRPERGDALGVALFEGGAEIDGRLLDGGPVLVARLVLFAGARRTDLDQQGAQRRKREAPTMRRRSSPGVLLDVGQPFQADCFHKR